MCHLMLSEHQIIFSSLYKELDKLKTFKVQYLHLHRTLQPHSVSNQPPRLMFQSLTDSLLENSLGSITIAELLSRLSSAC